MLEIFFAVTATSLYEARAKNENGYPCICRIESRTIKPRRKKKKFLENTIMCGTLLAVARWLQFFNPKKMRSGRQERRLQKVSTLQWQGGTPLIVALFLTEDKARECFTSSDHKPCDPRWLKDTKEVLVAIGKNHPTIVICRGRSKYWRERALIY